MKDDSNVKLGKCLLHFWNTPGHTLESSSIFLCDPDIKKSQVDSFTNTDDDQEMIFSLNPKAVFTGDTIFIGDVGRPDLAVSAQNNIKKEDLSGMMFDTVQRFKKLPDDLTMFPGHGAGSACGKNISNASSCTIGNQKKKNYAFNINNLQEFINVHTSDIPAPPSYFFYDVQMNQNEKILDVDEVLKRGLNPLKPLEFHDKILTNNYHIIDCRFLNDFSKSFIPGSVLAPLNDNMAIYAAQSFVDFEKPVLLVAYPGTEKECMKRLARTGIDNFEGFLHTFYDYYLEGFPIDKINSINPKDLYDIYSVGDNKINIVDVRNLSEFKNGHVDNAINAPLPVLNIIHEQLLKDKELNYYVHCKGGLRSVIAYSYLKSQGFKNLKNIRGGFDKMLKYGFKVIKK